MWFSPHEVQHSILKIARTSRLGTSDVVDCACNTINTPCQGGHQIGLTNVAKRITSMPLCPLRLSLGEGPSQGGRDAHLVTGLEMCIIIQIVIDLGGNISSIGLCLMHPCCPSTAAWLFMYPGYLSTICRFGAFAGA